MAQYAPLRDAFGDFTKLLIDKQEWDARRETEQHNRARDNMILQSQLEDAALRRESMKRQAARDREAMREVEVNIFDVVPNNEYSQRKIFDSPDGAVRFARLMGGSNIDRATGRILDDNGNAVKMQKGTASDRMVSAFASISPLFDPEEMMGENLKAIDSKVLDMENELKALKPSDVGKKKQLMERLTEAKTTRTQTLNGMEPEKLLPWYKQRQSHIENLIAQTAGSGDPQVLQALQSAATRMQQDYLQVQQRVMMREAEALKAVERKEEKSEERKLRKELKAMDIQGKIDEAKEKAKARKLKPSVAERSLEEDFKLEDEKGLKSREIPDANIPRFAAAKDLLGKYLESSSNETAAAMKARNIVLNAELAFIEDVKQELEANEITEPNEIKAFTETMAADGFAKQFKYIPNLQHESSLRKLLGR